MITVKAYAAQSNQLGSTERVCTLIAFVLFVAMPVLSDAANVAGAVTACVLALIALTRRYQWAGYIALLAAVCGVLFLAGLRIPQLALVLGLAACAIGQRRLGWLTGGFGWARAGRYDVRACLLGLAVVSASAISLVLWHAFAKPDHTDLFAKLGFLHWPLPMLLAGALAFSLLNAAVEEGVYRGLLMHSLEQAFSLPLALLMQALAFGVLHLWGFPGGWIGVALATVYGTLMGIVRVYARGMLVPWAAHVLTDLTICAILLRAAG